jgi:hypothetical protein
MFCVCDDSTDEAVWWPDVVGDVQLLWVALEYGRTACVQLAGAAKRPFVSVLAHDYTHSGVVHPQSILQLAIGADYGRIESDEGCFARLRYERRILTPCKPPARLDVTRVVISGIAAVMVRAGAPWWFHSVAKRNAKQYLVPSLCFVLHTSCVRWRFRATRGPCFVELVPLSLSSQAMERAENGDRRVLFAGITPKGCVCTLQRTVCIL